MSKRRRHPDRSQTEHGSTPRASRAACFRPMFVGGLLVIAGVTILVWGVWGWEVDLPRPPNAGPRKAGTQNAGTQTSDSTLWQVEIAPVSQWGRTSEHEQVGDVFVPPTGDRISKGYIGTAECRRCHESQFASYTETAHWRSCRVSDPEQEPAGASFEHARSSSRYDVFREKGRLFHRETLVGKEGQTLSVTELPVSLTVGSGTHARTYLCESDGKFLESPITWYREVGWDLSPGYDLPIHPSFSRMASDDCLFCHVGRVERSRENSRECRIIEHSISCERCHGPGEDHRQFQADVVTSGRDEFSDVEDPIVHPGRLSRELSEAICQQCHLQGMAFATAAGATLWDFQPGEPLGKVRTDFQYSGNDEFRVAGHVEQLHKSACYLGSDTLTCITCHDPHYQPPHESQVDYYRQKCIQCHESESCDVDDATRMARNNNACSQCHMPRRATDVTHAALHQHQIGIYKGESAPRVEPVTEIRLVPLVHYRELAQSEQTRRTVLAVHYALTSGVSLQPLAGQFSWAIQTAYDAVKSGEADVAVEAMLARNMMSLGKHDTAVQLAKRILVRAREGTRENNEARDILGEFALTTQNNQDALSQYRRLTKVRHDANDWYLLGMCERNAGNINAAIDAFRRSLAIRPDLVVSHLALEELLMTEEPDLANSHRGVRQALQAIHG
ncbi:MAG: multiheme c-type cytochrome [Rhodopirellula sp. JB053]